MSDMVEQPTMVRPGHPDKNFSLKDQHDKTFDLIENSGSKTLLSFQPLARWKSGLNIWYLQGYERVFGAGEYYRGGSTESDIYQVSLCP